MSVVTGSDIKNDDIVFYYDMSNTKKSWYGQPTTNILANSELLSSWGKSGGIASVVGSELAPDNTYTAWKVTANGTTNSFIGLTASLVSGNTYTKSVYAKAGTTSTLVFESYADNGSGGTTFLTTTFNLTTGTYTGTGHTATIIPIGNGWYRCIATYTCNKTGNGGTFYIGAYGNGSGTLFLWHPMVEQTSTASAYIGSSNTRSNTQAILDISNNNTITATSLTYDNDGTFRFNGSNYLDITDTTVIRLCDVTFEICFSLNGISVDQDLLNKGIHNINTPLLIWFDKVVGSGDYGVGNTNCISVSCFDGIINNHWVSTTTNSINSTNTFYFLTVVLKPSTDQILIYINGQLNASNTKNWNGIQNINSAINIGRGGNGINYLSGKIPYFKIYNTALTDIQVKQNFEAVRTRYGI